MEKRKEEGGVEESEFSLFQENLQRGSALGTMPTPLASTWSLGKYLWRARASTLLLAPLLTNPSEVPLPSPSLLPLLFLSFPPLSPS
jgi:hypothetical protein